MKKPSHIEILLMEDSPSDVLMTLEALRGATVLNNVNVVEDGAEGMAYIRQEGKYANAIRPHLILLDLNLPKMTGLQVLAELKSDPDLRLIPVVMLTTSNAEADVVAAYGRHVNCYVSKPITFADFTSVIRSIEKFWFTVVVLPEEAT